MFSSIYWYHCVLTKKPFENHLNSKLTLLSTSRFVRSFNWVFLTARVQKSVRCELLSMYFLVVIRVLALQDVIWFRRIFQWFGRFSFLKMKSPFASPLSHHARVTHLGRQHSWLLRHWSFWPWVNDQISMTVSYEFQKGYCEWIFNDCWHERLARVIISSSPHLSSLCM